MAYGRFRRGRKSVREQALTNLATERFYAGALPEGDSRAEANSERIHGLEQAIPAKRHRIRRPVDGKAALPLEKEILADILQALHNDRRIGYVWRHSSGVFQDGERYIRTGPSGLPDLIGFLTGSGRAFFLEVKRPGLKADERQAQRLDHFKRSGAIAGVCWSVESALALLG